jgi:hypothetical protein
MRSKDPKIRNLLMSMEYLGGLAPIMGIVFRGDSQFVVAPKNWSHPVEVNTTMILSLQQRSPQN